MKPLTIEELKELEVGDWVWFISINKNGVKQKGEYRRIEENVINRIYLSGAYSSGNHWYENYGFTWLAYKNKEQAEAKGEIVELPCIIEVQDLNSVRYDIYFKRTEPPYKGSLDFYVRKTREEAEARLKELQEKL